MIKSPSTTLDHISVVLRNSVTDERVQQTIMLNFPPPPMPTGPVLSSSAFKVDLKRVNGFRSRFFVYLHKYPEAKVAGFPVLRAWTPADSGIDMEVGAAQALQGKGAARYPVYVLASGVGDDVPEAQCKIGVERSAANQIASLNIVVRCIRSH